MNKTINGSQCTIVFHDDDNKISHEDPEVVSDILGKISNHFGELSVIRGPEFRLLGMDIKVKDKNIYISMKDQLLEVIQMYRDQAESLPATPATKNLFNMNREEDLVNESDAKRFHSVLAKLLFISKRGRPDIKPVIAYLCTRVSCTTNGNMKKLHRLICYIKSTLNDTRVIGADLLKVLHTWIDASYAVHQDMKGQTGGEILLGTGLIHGQSSKQKINAKSSTESDLIGVSEYLPFHVWTVNFHEKQGYNLERKILYQDNMSAMRLKKNGRNS